MTQKTAPTNADRSAPLVEVQGLTKTFDHGGRKLQVLKGIDLILQRGEMLAVSGMSGAGKSTLLQIVGTLDRPTSGRIVFNGIDLATCRGSQLATFRNQRIGFVFQFHHLLPEFTAMENVMMPALIQRVPRMAAKERAGSLLSEVGLAHRLDHRPGELSGGEQQRVALARALVLQPDLLLADEPTGNLDSKTGGEVHQLFWKLNEQLGTTMMLVTHNRTLAASLPRTLEMADGRFAGPTARQTGQTKPATVAGKA